MAEARLTTFRKRADSTELIPGSNELVRLSNSHSGNERLLAFLLMRRCMDSDAETDAYLAASGAHLADPDLLVRYQAMIVLSAFVESEADRVFNYVIQASARVGSETRRDLGCVVFEELLEYDFETYFLRTREAIGAGNHYLLDVLDASWFNDFGAKYEAAQQYVAEARRQIAMREHAAQQGAATGERW